MGEKSVIVIGAGVAGLSTGCYARMNGYAARIFEHHFLPGGLCTAWKRGDYTIDGCVHWLMGSAPGSELHRIWDELGVIHGRQFVYPDEFFRLEDTDGRVLIFYTDLDKLGKHLKELSPPDAGPVDRLIKDVRACCHFNIPVGKAPELQGWLDKVWFRLRSLPIAPVFRRWKDLSIADVAGHFRDPLLQEAVRSVFMPGFPAMFMIFTIGSLATHSAGYPIGGSLPLAQAMERRYLALGGTLHYSARVAKILVEHDRAVGVRLMDGTEHRADYVVSAADGYSTVFEILGGQYVDAEVRRRFDSYTPFPGLVWVAIGVNRTFADVPISVVGTLVRQQPPLRVGNREQEWLGLHIYNQDPTLAPKGKTLITTGLLADYAYWSDLYERPDEYEAAKNALAQEVIRRMDQWCPGLAGQVEMLDVATPATFHRYTLNWQGSFEGWLATPANWLERIQKTLPGLRNFHMAGQWVEIGGGLPSAAFSGRHVVQLLCKQDGKRFKAQRHSHDGDSTPNAETPG